VQRAVESRGHCPSQQYGIKVQQRGRGRYREGDCLQVVYPLKHGVFPSINQLRRNGLKSITGPPTAVRAGVPDA